MKRMKAWVVKRAFKLIRQIISKAQSTKLQHREQPSVRMPVDLNVLPQYHSHTPVNYVPQHSFPGDDDDEITSIPATPG